LRDNRHLAFMLVSGMACLVFGVLCLCFDHRLVLGEYAWIKPCKFGLSIATYAASLLWLAGYVGIYKPIFDWFARFAFWGALVELASLAVQASGVCASMCASAPGDSVLAQLPGLILVVAIKLAIMPVALIMPITLILLCKQRNLPQVIGASLRWAVFIATLGMIPGLIMVMPGEHHLALLHQGHSALHTVGAHVGVSPWLGWSNSGGDLRPSHFFGLHALQFMPLAAFAVGRCLSGWSGTAQTLVVHNIGVTYTACLMLLTVQALCGESVFYPGANTVCLVLSTFALSIFGFYLISSFCSFAQFLQIQVTGKSEGSVTGANGLHL